MATEPAFLIVDDVSTVRKQIRHFLRELGYVNVEEAEDGEIAMLKLNRYRYDVVILDWVMPVKDGMAVLREVRATEHLAHLPIIMVTGESTRDSVIRAAAAGANSYIVKPFSLPTFSSKLQRVMSRANIAA
ncbi:MULTISPECIES: response regulator [Herbaspirillum]|uniref:Response regulator n=2 Tax=Herbaspirillum huttiense TaxID=863372 RepID=A0AAJ2LTZ1_9BURK|nr:MULTISPECIES: response regulator [Herbaspirillum]MDR9836825.1 response regulator [Herbaspirillum huttiense]